MWRAWVEGVMTGRITGFAAGFYRALATVPSYGYAAAVHGRHLLYDCGLLQVERASLPMISVGNLTCGGNGKTPFVRLLAQLLAKQGKSVGILSRGYGGSFRGTQRVYPREMDPEVCGDEPWMLASTLSEACVIVGKDRVEAAKIAAHAGADILLLDDGMQYRRLVPDLNVVMVDSSDESVTRYYLPKGHLRDTPSRLATADLIVSLGGPLSAPLRALTTAACIEGRVVCRSVRDATGREMEVPKRVALFCGIGKPERFLKTVIELGCQVVWKKYLADHGKMTPTLLRQFVEEAKRAGAQAVLCTEKDWVKGGGLLEPHLLPIGIVHAEIEMIPKHLETLNLMMQRKWI